MIFRRLLAKHFMERVWNKDNSKRGEQRRLYRDRISEVFIDKINPNEVFVFGSNLSGIHRGGAARQAHQEFGAEWGVGVGITGYCYAIPTKTEGIKRSMTVLEIKPYVDEFIEKAKEYKEFTFLVTPIGTGLAGIDPKNIALLFKGALDIPNIHLPMLFWNYVLEDRYY